MWLSLGLLIKPKWIRSGREWRALGWNVMGDRIELTCNCMVINPFYGDSEFSFIFKTQFIPDDI